MPVTVRTVFIIDDDKSVLRALRRLIRSAGFNVMAFATAEEFLQAAERPTPDCLILDVHLPGMTGLELQERLIAEGRRIPIVLITAFPDGGTRERAQKAGAIAFLQKPFEDQALLDAVALCMN
jgi:FixJ family two-component response regulator